jgi:hypothetical protein
MNRNDEATEFAHEMARRAADLNMSPDEDVSSDASLDTSVPEARDGLAGFDSRKGGHHVLFAVQPGYEVVDKGMAAPLMPYDIDWQFVEPHRRTPGRIHYSLNHMRPTRIVELQRKP